MTAEARVTTREVTELVDEYVESELRDAERYTNSTPLDQSGVWSLHKLAAEVYARGFRDGQTVEAVRSNAERRRAKDAK